jgi:hypothetical protein
MNDYYKNQDPVAQLIADAYDNSRIINFHVGLAKALGSNNAALFLQQCIFWTKNTSDPEGWFRKSIKEFNEEINLTEWEQKQCVKLLKKLGIIEVKRVGVGALRYIRFNFDGFVKFLQKTGRQYSCVQKVQRAESRIVQIGGIHQSDWRNSPI